MRVVGCDGGMLVPSRRNSGAAKSIITALATNSGTPVATSNHQSMPKKHWVTNRSAAQPQQQRSQIDERRRQACTRTVRFDGHAHLQSVLSNQHRLLGEDIHNVDWHASCGNTRYSLSFDQRFAGPILPCLKSHSNSSFNTKAYHTTRRAALLLPTPRFEIAVSFPSN